MTETGAGYKIYWSRRDADERMQSGVGFAVRNALIPTVASLPKGKCSRLMTMRLKPLNDHKPTIISDYATTMTCDQAAKDRFYEKLENNS